MFTLIFWQKTCERFVRGFATAFVLTTSAADALIPGANFDFGDRAYLGLVQGVGAVAISIIGSGIGDKTSPSLLPSPPEPAIDAHGEPELP